MKRLLVTRLAWFVPSFVVVTFITFSVAQLAPGDPLQLGESPTPIAIDQAERERPLLLRYGTWLSRAAQLELGVSVVDRRPVTERIAEALPRTLLISGLAFLLSVAGAIGVGTLLATRRASRFARLVSGSLVIGSAIPLFWLAVLALFVFASPHGVELFPMQGLASDAVGVFERAWHVALPICCLAFPLGVSLTRFIRDSVTSALDGDLVRFARARGLPERRIIWRHAVPNALVPIVAVIGLNLPAVVIGSAVIERVFGLPGMGGLAFDAIGSRDYPVVMGVTTVVALTTLLALTVSDVVAAWLDPRLVEARR